MADTATRWSAVSRVARRVIRTRWFRSATAALGGLLVALATVVTFASARPGNVDDAFVVLVYARHLARDGALYWNAEDGVVDGFTSMLDLLVKTAGMALFRDPFEMAFWVTMAAFVLCPSALLVILWRSRRGVGSWSSLGVGALAALTLATSQAIAFGSGFLLETPLFVLCTLALLAWCFRWLREVPRYAWLVAGGGLGFIVSLARPEGVVLGLVAIAYGLVATPRSAARWKRWVPGCVFLLLVGTFYGWRIGHFGHWAPNTYYAKSSSSRWQELVDGVDYLRIAWTHHENKIYLGAIALGWTLLWPRAWRDLALRRPFFLAWLLALASVLSVLASGGDSYRTGMRFFAVAFALASAMLALAALGLRGWRKLAPLAALVAVVAIQLTYWAERGDLIRARLRAWPLSLRRYRCEAQAYRTLAAIEPRWTVAHSDCQRFKFFSDRTRVIDLYGLNYAPVAHQPRSGPVAFGKYDHFVGLEIAAPVWIWGNRSMHVRQMALVPMPKLVLDTETIHDFTTYRRPVDHASAQRMVELYAPASMPVCGRWYFNFLVRRDVAGQLRAAGVLVGW